MFKILFSLLLLFCSCTCFAFQNSPCGKVQVTRIIDGDTIEIQLQKTKAKLRLGDIDCFETSANFRAYKQAYENNLKINEVLKKGEQAKEFTKKFFKQNGSVVFADIQGVDYYGRLLGEVKTQDGKILSKILLEQGICKEYKYNAE